MTGRPKEPPMVYELDAEARLTQVDEAWTEFAVSNGAPELAPPTPLGRPLYSFIGDLTTISLYEGILARVRSAQRGVRFPIRCDAPAARRFLDIRIEPSGEGVRIESTAVRIEPRPSVSLLDSTQRRSDELLRSCGWCERILVGDKWVEVETAIERLRLFEQSELPGLTHGICDECLARMEAVVTDG